MPELVVRPGDTLIVCRDGRLDRSQADELKQRIKERLPGLRDVVILTETTALAAYRPEASDAAA
jgi:hypothetical protein